jgi:SRSO17 transposase
LPTTVVEQLPDRLRQTWGRYRGHFWTRTRDQGAHGYEYMSGLLRMLDKRTYSSIAREAAESGDNIQHFMSNSPWSGRGVVNQVQREVSALWEEQADRVLILDESADAKAGLVSAGSGRQHNGRLGKEDVCQVGVFLTLACGSIWTWIDGELFVPEAWFQSAALPRRQRVGIPETRTFHTKVELGWQMIERVQSAGVPFDWFTCDDLYGRANWFRAKLAAAKIVYSADVPRNTQVYLQRPTWGVPAHKKRGKQPRRPRVLSPESPLPVSVVAQDPDTVWQTVRVRSTERGELIAPYAARLVWTLRDDEPTQEWLVLRREADGEIRYALSNAPTDATLPQLAYQESARCFVECSIRDAKSELGWDDFQAIKYRAWEHQLALTILASWFIAETRWEWRVQFPPDATLPAELGVAVLPTLSVANVRELLRAAMPLRQLSITEAQDLVCTHLLNRARSRQSRLKKQCDILQFHSRDPA